MSATNLIAFIFVSFEKSRTIIVVGMGSTLATKLKVDSYAKTIHLTGL